MSKQPVTVGHEQGQQGGEGPEEDGRQEVHDPRRKPKAVGQQRDDRVGLRDQVFRRCQKERN